MTRMFGVFLRSRIIKSLRFQKTSKVIEFNFAQMHIHTFFQTLPGMRTLHFHGQLVPLLYNPFHDRNSLNISSKPSLAQPDTISSSQSFVTWEKQLTPTSL